MPNKRKNASKRPFNQTQRHIVVGSGDYKTAIKKAAKVAVKAAVRNIRDSNDPHALARYGGQLGGAIGGKFGKRALGQRVGRALGTLAVEGMGDYAIKTNSLIQGSSNSTSTPTFVNDGKRGNRIIEMEYICDIVAGMDGTPSTGFNLQSFRINPSDPVTFPWLSQLARLYDQWEPNGIIFHYKTTSSTFNGANQALGVVMMATDYDVSDPSYSNKVQMENAAYSCSTSPAAGLMHGIECDSRERPTKVLYTGEARTGTPLSMHDLGNFQIATQGVSEPGITLGELWVTYDVTFYKKSISEPGISLNLPFLKQESIVHNQNLTAATPFSVSPIYSMADQGSFGYELRNIVEGGLTNQLLGVLKGQAVRMTVEIDTEGTSTTASVAVEYLQGLLNTGIAESQFDETLDSGPTFFASTALTASAGRRIVFQQDYIALSSDPKFTFGNLRLTATTTARYDYIAKLSVVPVNTSVSN